VNPLNLVAIAEALDPSLMLEKSTSRDHWQARLP